MSIHPKTIFIFLLLLMPGNVFAQSPQSAQNQEVQLPSPSSSTSTEKSKEPPKDPLKEKVSLDYKDVDIATVLRSLSHTYGLNLVTSSEIKGKITISLKDVTVQAALDVILTANDYYYTLKENIIFIMPKTKEEKEEPQVSEPIILNYLKVSDAQNLLNKVLSPQGDIKIDETANLLIVTDFQKNVEKLKELVKTVDQAPQQVLIEAKIVDITSQDLDNLGVTWQFDYNPGTGLFNRKSLAQERLTGGGNYAGPSSSLNASQFELNTLSIKDLTISATIDALIQDQKAHLLASPSIAVLNNREARIIIGEKVPFKERTQTTTGTSETTKFIDVGTTLRVTPSINADGYITMAIHPEVSSVTALLDAGPRITTREADTMVRVKEGETIVIGGLIKQEDARKASHTPFLGKIPLIGFLFSNRSKDQSQTELAVFITPKILRSREEMLKESKTLYEEEAYVNLLATGNLNAQKVLFEKAQNLEEGKGLESRRKEEWLRKNQALSMFEAIYTQFPDGPKAAESGYRAARIYFEYLEEYYLAKDLCARIISDYPDSPYAEKAKSLYKRIELILEHRASLKMKKKSQAKENQNL